MGTHMNDPKVDAEHAMILQLLESCLSLEDPIHPDERRRLLVRLKDHVVLHFVDEEFLFDKQYSMPADYVAHHKAEHERLRALVLASARDLLDCDADTFRDGVAALGVEIDTHIRTVDAMMNTYIDSVTDGA